MTWAAGFERPDETSPRRPRIGPATTVTARYWTAATLTTVLGEAGFDTIDWLPHRTTAIGADAYFRPYLSVPHAALLRRVKDTAR